MTHHKYTFDNFNSFGRRDCLERYSELTCCAYKHHGLWIYISAYFGRIPFNVRLVQTFKPTCLVLVITWAEGPQKRPCATWKWDIGLPLPSRPMNTWLHLGSGECGRRGQQKALCQVLWAIPVWYLSCCRAHYPSDWHCSEIKEKVLVVLFFFTLKVLFLWVSSFW